MVAIFHEVAALTAVRNEKKIPHKNTNEKTPVQRYTNVIKILLPVYRSAADTGITGNTEPKMPVFRYTGYRCTSLTHTHTHTHTV